MGCNCSKRAGGQTRYVAIDPLSGDCLVDDGNGGCARFLSPQGARNAAVEAGYAGRPGVRRVVS